MTILIYVAKFENVTVVDQCYLLEIVGIDVNLGWIGQFLANGRVGNRPFRVKILLDPRVQQEKGLGIEDIVPRTT